MIFIIFSSILFTFGLIFKDILHNTPFSCMEYIVFLSGYLLSGYSVLWEALHNIRRGKIFDENFLMMIATLGAIFIHELPEAVGVMLFFKTGEFLQSISINRSKRSIKALLDTRPDYANIKTRSGLKKVPPEEVNPGDIIVVKPGEKIPLDGKILEGNSLVDTSNLTGESIPRTARKGEEVLAGMINKTGLLTLRVNRKFEESSMSKILKLVEDASNKKAKTEKFITKFARYYTPGVVSGAIFVALILPLLIQGANFSEWIYRALILLVISCPCALVISIPLGYFGGIGAASRKGILIKGANYLDVLTKVKVAVFDKTGTLTKGKFEVTEIVPKNGFSKKTLLQIAAKAESRSNHPIAQSILKAYGKKISLSSVKDYKEIPGYGVKAKLEDQEVLVGNDRLLHKENIQHDTCNIEGTVVHIAVNNLYAGYLIIGDEIKEDAQKIVESLKKLGVKKVVMLTGDDEKVAAAIVRRIGLDDFSAELLPEDKVREIERIKESLGKEEKVAFVGDGINDAPVIAIADVGVAMGGLGSDAAIEIADVVIMTDAPSKLATAIRIGKKTHRIVWQNIVFAFAVKAIFITLGIMGMATMWEAVFADVGVALLAIFNAIRII